MVYIGRMHRSSDSYGTMWGPAQISWRIQTQMILEWAFTYLSTLILRKELALVSLLFIVEKKWALMKLRNSKKSWWLSKIASPHIQHRCPQTKTRRLARIPLHIVAKPSKILTANTPIPSIYVWQVWRSNLASYSTVVRNYAAIHGYAMNQTTHFILLVCYEVILLCRRSRLQIMFLFYIDVTKQQLQMSYLWPLTSPERYMTIAWPLCSNWHYYIRGRHDSNLSGYG